MEELSGVSCPEPASFLPLLPVKVERALRWESYGTTHRLDPSLTGSACYS